MKQLIKFMIVGGVGTIFVEGSLFLFAKILGSIPTLLIFLELSIILNFFMNDRWTFTEVKSKTLRRRLLIFQTTSLLTYGLNTATFVLASPHFGIYVAELIAVAVAFIINYLVASRVTFLGKK